MSSAKSILVLMSTYNGEQFLEAQVRSVMNQKSQHTVTLRIRDDGSSDRTCEIIEKLQGEYPARIELIKAKNKGCNASFFELLKNASGYDYYSISDQDDVWLENKLDFSVEALSKEDNSIPLLFASTSYLTKNDLVPYGTTRKKKKDFSIYNTLVQCICPGHTQVMNNALLDKIKVDIDVNKIYVYDSWVMNMAMLYGKIVFTNDSYTYYRQHESQQLGSGVGMMGHLKACLQRIKANDGKKYRNQIQYFCEVNKEKMESLNCYKEIECFLSATTFFQRVGYAFKSKLYRQSPVETLALRMAIVAGKYL